jgi:hypothetical protein
MRPGRSVDVLSRLRPERVRVTCFDIEWDLYPDCAYDWLGLVGADMETLAGVFPGGVCDDQCEAMLAVSHSFDDRDDRWANAARVALGRAGGRDWWWVLNLSRRCLQGWQYVNGRLLREGINARTVLFPDWLDAAYMMLWDGQDDKGRTLFDIELNRIPAGVAVRRDFTQIQAMAQAFAAD